ncbi:MAG: hypothetical protein K2P50_12085, partial [Lachnospiraceae bacterium]|nr:hypothetical protein [Lachnospiraceae bacterium]
KDYHFQVENAAVLKRLLSSNQNIYGGCEKEKDVLLKAGAGGFSVTLQPFSAEYYEVDNGKGLSGQ